MSAETVGDQVEQAELFDLSPVPSELERAYSEWRSSADGQSVYHEVVRRARLLRARGWPRFGIKAIWEALRFDRSLLLSPDSQGWKLNNNYPALMAREVMRAEPDLEGFFATRDRR